MSSRVCCHCRTQVAPHSSICPSCRKLLIVNHKFALRRQIGRGGFGTVFEGSILGTPARCAIKLVEAATPQQERQIQTEIAILQTKAAGLSFIPHIYGAWRDGSFIYIVMEFIDGWTLNLAHWPGSYWHPERVKRFLVVMLKQLNQLHTRGIIHRDLNPNNIMRTADRQYKLLDFGIAKPDIRSQTIARGVGTLIYSPIEQLRGSGTGPYSDLYSLGVVAYQLLTGDPPPDALQRIDGLVVVPPSVHIPNVPTELDHTIMNLIGLNPTERPQNAVDALDILNNSPQIAPRMRPFPPPIVPPARPSLPRPTSPASRVVLPRPAPRPDLLRVDSPDGLPSALDQRFQPWASTRQ